MQIKRRTPRLFTVKLDAIADAGLTRACPICGGPPVVKLSGFKSAGLVNCDRRCVIYAGWEISPAELDTWYGEYHPVATELPELTAVRLRELVDGLEHARRTNVFFDFGCGDGYLLDAAQAAGWDAAGVEVTEPKVQALRARGIDAMNPTSPLLDSYAGRCDVVTAVEVIEHFSDPMQELAKWTRLLRPGGTLYVTTPNFNSISRYMLGPGWRVILFPEHLSYFTVPTLGRILIEHGLQDVQSKTTGASPQRLLASLRNQRESYFDHNQTVRAGLVVQQDRKLRDLLAHSRVLRSAVNGVNLALGATRVGDTIKTTARAPG